MAQLVGHCPKKQKVISSFPSTCLGCGFVPPSRAYMGGNQLMFLSHQWCFSSSPSSSLPFFLKINFFLNGIKYVWWRESLISPSVFPYNYLPNYVTRKVYNSVHLMLWDISYYLKIYLGLHLNSLSISSCPFSKNVLKSFPSFTFLFIMLPFTLSPKT